MSRGATSLQQAAVFVESEKIPFKSISVPTRNATKKRGGAPSSGSIPTYAPATSAATSPRGGSNALAHRFVVGQRLAMAPGGREFARGAATCSVVSLLPHEGGPLRYRVRSDNESYERIVDENDLSPLPSDPEGLIAT